MLESLIGEHYTLAASIYVTVYESCSGLSFCELFLQITFIFNITGHVIFYQEGGTVIFVCVCVCVGGGDHNFFASLKGDHIFSCMCVHYTLATCIYVTEYESCSGLSFCELFLQITFILILRDISFFTRRGYCNICGGGGDHNFFCLHERGSHFFFYVCALHICSMYLCN